MRLVADTHVHLYSRHPLAAQWARIAADMDRSGGGPGARILCLADRASAGAFPDALTDQARAGGFAADRLPDDPGGAVLLSGGPRAPMYVCPGRQFATSERLEILGLACTLPPGDGLSAEETIRRVLAEGGVPVLTWSPGKWLFGRRALVQRLLARFDPGQLLLGDTALRPQSCGEPRPMREARTRGFGVLAGSDPLPPLGEERYIGTYVTVWDAAFDPARPCGAVRALLRTGERPELRLAGRRCATIESLNRFLRMKIANASTHEESHDPSSRYDAH
jgi:hypothetical protein